MPIDREKHAVPTWSFTLLLSVAYERESWKSLTVSFIRESSNVIIVQDSLWNTGSQRLSQLFNSCYERVVRNRLFVNDDTSLLRCWELGRLARWRKWRACDIGEALLILQPFRQFTYVTAHSANLPSLYLRHSSFSHPSVASPTSQLILQTFRRFIYVTTHSPTLPFASPTSQLILQPLLRFSYVTGSSLTSLGEPPMIYIPVPVNF